MIRRLLVLVVVLASGCGQTVTALSIHDQRLPADARRWIADAEDAVAIGRAWRDEAQTDLDSVVIWRDRTLDHVKWPSGAKASDASAKLEQMANDRVALARAELAEATARLDLARAKRVQANAQTAMRYDLAVYDLRPLRKRTDAARAEVKKLRDAAENKRIILDKATTAWWQAYQAYVAGGGNNEVLWVQH